MSMIASPCAQQIYMLPLAFDEDRQACMMNVEVPSEDAPSTSGSIDVNSAPSGAAAATSDAPTNANPVKKRRKGEKSDTIQTACNYCD
jgi:hypothetical protein